MKDKKALPFLKWAGGKRQSIPFIEKVLPKEIQHYYEPFVGGGALLFHLQPKVATINDLNKELINCYSVVKNDKEALIKDLSSHKNEKEYFFNIRSVDRKKEFHLYGDVKRASRFIYLNKTCFNGLYRVNSFGQFNSSFGTYKNPKILDAERLRSVSSYLNSNKVEILNVSFEKALPGLDRDSFVYLDPPYDPLPKKSNFTGYIRGGFNKSDHKRLKSLCDFIDSSGAKFLLSSSYTEFISSLYSSYERIGLRSNRLINSDAKKRGKVKDLLIKNY